MDPNTLKNLLRRQEGADLEFKRQWYELENPNQKKAEADKGEMIKDILSLANGNAAVAGEESYLVIGASNEIDEPGNRQLFEVVSSKPITRQRILDIVNLYCDPAVEDILCEEVFVDGKKLLVITILPSPHVHETIKKLKTAKITYDKYTVFVRHAEGVRTASTKERIALQEIKKARFSDTVNVSPVPFGTALGALFFGLLGPKLITKENDSKEKINAARVASVSVGALMGGLVGSNYAQLKAIRIPWKLASPKHKIISSMAGTAFGLGSWWLIQYWDRKHRNKKKY